MRDTHQPGAAFAVAPGYRLWVLALLLAINAVNFIDRTIINILSQPIKVEFQLADWQIGLMGGLTFALFYAGLGLPIAWMAERRGRVTIISLAIACWSLMTALCGVAQNYAQLLLCRIGVGVGEAGCSPPAHSLISDYFPPHQRATALSVFSVGVPLGALIGAVFGGWAGEHLGWRTAMILVGLPGLVLALLARLTLREPPRGHSEVAVPGAVTGLEAAPDAPAPRMVDVAKLLFSNPAFVHIAAGATLSSFASYGIGAFSAPWFMREFGLPLQTVGFVAGLIGGISAGVGTLLGGLLTDWVGKRDIRAYVLIPAAGLIISSPLYIWAYVQPDWRWVVGLLIVPGILHYLFLGPSFAVTHSLVQPRMRATASAILVLVMTIIGLGLGPLLVGLGGDIMAGQAFAAAGLGDFAAVCPGGVAPAGSPAALQSGCVDASASGIRQAIIACAAVYAWSGLHYVLAARSLRPRAN